MKPKLLLKEKLAICVDKCQAHLLPLSLCLAAIFFLIKITATLTAPSEEFENTVHEPPTPQGSRKKTAPANEPVSSSNFNPSMMAKLFPGNASANASNTAVKTSLALVLKAVFVDTDGPSVAFIERRNADKNQKTSLYIRGDTLPGGATIESISNEKVLLRYQGRNEALLFTDTTFEVSQNKLYIAKNVKNAQSNELLSKWKALSSAQKSDAIKKRLVLLRGKQRS